MTNHHGDYGDYGEALVALARVRARRAGHPSATPAPSRALVSVRSIDARPGAQVVSLTAYRSHRRLERGQAAAAAWRSAR